jgi:nicotinamidase-related amidase
MKETLVVVDMQKQFRASEYVEQAVIKEIRRARRYTQPIIVLEYYGFGRTMSNVRKALSGYNHVIFKKKIDDSGASVILANSTAKRFKIVGVNVEACVMYTALDLAAEKAKVRILLHACGSSNHDARERFTKELARYNWRLDGNSVGLVGEMSRVWV